MTDELEPLDQLEATQAALAEICDIWESMQYAAPEMREFWEEQMREAIKDARPLFEY